MINWSCVTIIILDNDKIILPVFIYEKLLKCGVDYTLPMHG